MNASAKGFTLIEVLMALVVIALVVSAMMGRLNHWAEQRFGLEERFTARTIAWNPLMERYMDSNDMRPANTTLKKEDVVDNGLQDWTWQLSIEEAQGENLFRFETTVYDGRDTLGSAEEKKRNSANLVAYWILSE